jgi:hypothetical protein
LGERDARQVGLERGVGEVGQERLAHTGRVRRAAAPDRRVHADAVVGVAAVDVDQVVAVEDREVDGLPRRPVQLGQRRGGVLAHVQVVQDRVAELQQAEPERVLRVSGSWRAKLCRMQARQQAMRGGGREPAAARDLAQRQRVLGLEHGAEHGQRPVRGLARRLRLAAWRKDRAIDPPD